jgi:hypothetical protein
VEWLQGEFVFPFFARANISEKVLDISRNVWYNLDTERGNEYVFCTRI